MNHALPINHPINNATALFEYFNLPSALRKLLQFLSLASREHRGG